MPDQAPPCPGDATDGRGRTRRSRERTRRASVTSRKEQGMRKRSGLPPWLVLGLGFVLMAFQAHGALADHLYRYYNAGNGDHFYTLNKGELGNGSGGYS